MATFLAASDGSWCEIDHHAEDDRHQLREAGPTPFWTYIENAHQLWHDTGRPGWNRFGVTVTRDRQYVWLDDPANSEHSWPITQASFPRPTTELLERAFINGRSADTATVSLSQAPGDQTAAEQGETGCLG